MITWECLSFKQLTTEQLYKILKLRSDVFVVEQNCVYPDIDGKDRHAGSYHLMGVAKGELAAYLRLLPAGVSYPSVSMGRIVVSPAARQYGYGHKLLEQGLALAKQFWPDQDIEIGAQEYLIDFYQHHGFVASSEVYIEDGIPHLDMKLS